MTTLKNLVDETTNIKNELKTCHANLKTNLTAKGVTVGSSDKMLNLISKISNIPLGKKWASGESPSQSAYKLFDYVGESYTNTYYVDIPALGFKPTFVCVFRKDAGYGYISMLRPYNEGYVVNTANTSNTSTSNPTASYIANDKVFLSNGSIHVPVTSMFSHNLIWYAFE